MRLILTILFCCSAITAVAQRPWILRTSMTSGPRPTVVATASSVFVFDTIAMRTLDHGVTWEPVGGIVGRICGVTDFTAGLTILASFTALDRQVHMYFTLSGSSWTQFTEFASPTQPIALTASSAEWFVACENSNNIYVYGDTLSSIKLPTGAAPVDLKYWENSLYALDAKQGLFVSADKGSTWKLIPIKNASTLHTSSMGIYVATDEGVVSVMMDPVKVSAVGTWPGRTTAPRIADVDSYINALYAYTDDGAYQMYRLLGQNWEPIGYPLPGTLASRSRSVLAIDAGYAVLAHAVREGFTDSAGVYSYDLNDFTNIYESQQSSKSMPYVANDLLHLGDGYADVASVDVWSASGQKMFDVQPVSSTVVFPALARGVYIVRVCHRTSVQPHHILVVR